MPELPRFRMKIVIIVLVLLVLMVTVGWLYLLASLPKTIGTVSVAGLDGQVEIVRDKNGVPHIFASTDNDAFFALGYVHAQDRLWQMELQRRIGAGRLSEIMGDVTLDVDKFLRTLGTYRAGVSAWRALDTETKLAIEAYVAGVNGWIEEGHTLPVEFLILGVTPEPWTVYDSMVWSKMMMWDLGGNWDDELLRALLLPAVGQERTEELMPGYPSGATTILASDNAYSLLTLDSFLKDNLQLGGLDMGSNSWVIAGRHTESGQPLLANDPHLGASIPSIWYLVELQGEELHVTGTTFPGLPIVPIGHNDNIAWGLTNMGPDVQDLFIERINPQNPNQYEVDGEWVDMTIVGEEILVKGEEEILQYAARSTRHGPLISDVAGKVTSPLALRWTALDEGDTTAVAFFNMLYASNWDEFTDALSSYVAPSQNIVYGDREGNIGYYGPGRIPVRSKGNGTAPVPGWSSDYEWKGWIPFEELPHAFNPDEGFIVTANNKVVQDDYPYFISSSWAPPYRAERVLELIEQRTARGLKLSRADMVQIQGDQVSRQVQELMPYLLAVDPKDDREMMALEFLRKWDGEMDAESVAPTIYTAWFQQLGLVVFEDDLRGSVYEHFVERRHASFLSVVLSESANRWCDNVLPMPMETCVDATSQALGEALDTLEEMLGKSMGNWQWGKVHQTIYAQNPISEVVGLRTIFQRKIGNGGGPYTVNVGPYSFSEPYKQTAVPSYRQIVDLNDWNNSLFMHTTGQSGNLFSEHYDNLIDGHQRVEYLQMTFGRENVDGDVLVFKPD